MVRRIAGFLAPVALTTACGFAHPLGSEDAAVFDERLVGDWVEVDPEEGRSPMRLGIAPEGSGHSYIVMVHTEAASFDPFRPTAEQRGEKVEVSFRAFTVVIDSATFASALALDDESADWLIFRYGFSADGLLTLRELAADSVTRTFLPEQLKQYVKERLDDEAAYGEPTQLRRAIARID